MEEHFPLVPIIILWKSENGKQGVCCYWLDQEHRQHELVRSMQTSTPCSHPSLPCRHWKSTPRLLACLPPIAFRVLYGVLINWYTSIKTVIRNWCLQGTAITHWADADLGEPRLCELNLQRCVLVHRYRVSSGMASWLWQGSSFHGQHWEGCGSWSPSWTSLSQRCVSPRSFLPDVCRAHVWIPSKWLYNSTMIFVLLPSLLFDNLLD